ncbi:MAG: tRNA (adenosine(37)-N6)-threonylcarbamoyltransferase complex transferase subunit TsaD, partial [Chthoniobacterales bacterium]
RRDLIAVSGGVGLNGRLREALENAARAGGHEVLFAEAPLCTDNAAMVAYVAGLRAARGESSPLTVDISPSLGETLFVAA